MPVEYNTKAAKLVDVFISDPVDDIDAAVSTTYLTLEYCDRDVRHAQIAVYGSPFLARTIHRLLLIHARNKPVVIETSKK